MLERKMKNLISALILFVGVLVCLTTGLSIQATNHDVKVKTRHILEKDNLLLACNTSRLQDVDGFYWIKNNTIRKSSEFYAKGWKLEFFAISREAKGIYICHAVDNRTGENITLTAVKVDVEYPAECRSMFLSPQVITENETFSVSCSMHGNPEPSWGIYNNDTGRAILWAGLSSRVTLGGVPVTCGDSGLWVCSGKNRLNDGVNATRGYQLTVLCPPRPDPNSRTTNTYFSSGHNNVSMALNITADPVPTYIWSRDDSKTFGNVDVQKSPRGTTLTIYDVGVNDFGNYTLRMNNSMGSHEAHFTLHAYGYPGKPYNIRVSNISWDSVDVSWTSGYDFGSKQHFMIGKFVKNVFTTITEDISEPYKDGGLGQNWTYHVTGLDTDTEYKLAVIAGNAQNWSYSDPVIFNTTYTAPPNLTEKTTSVLYIVGYVLAGVMAVLFIIVFSVYLYDNRRRRTLPINGEEAIDNTKQYGGTYTLNGDMKQPMP